MDRLDSMDIFRRVAELGSFSAVARQMAAVLTAAVAADLVDDFAGVTMISPLL